MKTQWQHSIATLAAAAGILLVVAVDSHAILGFGKKQPLPTPAASVALVGGSVQVQAAAGGAWTNAVLGQPLNAGDKVKTGANGKAVVAFSDGSKIQLDANSNFSLTELQPARFGVRLDVGTLNAWVAKLRGRRFEARSPTAVAAVRGTEFDFKVEIDGKTTVNLFGGSLNLSNNAGRGVNLTPGKQATVEVKGEVSEPTPIPADVKQVAEPKVDIPEPKESEQKTEEQKPATTEETTTTQPPPPPPPNPIQNTETVSPSSP